MKRIEELNAELSRRVEQQDYAGAASVQNEIKAIGELGMTQGVPDDVTSGAATLDAERRRAMEVEIQALVARKDYAGAVALNQTMDGQPPSLAHSGGAACGTGEDVDVTIRAI